MPQQLTFHLPVRTALGRGDFFVSPANSTALALVEGTRHWPEGKLMLTGPAGAGKSHLAAVWAATTGAATMPATDLADADIAQVAATGALVIEDADHIGADPNGQVALFHLHNLILAQGGRLLLTASTPPGHWGLTLPDLLSRMVATALARIEAPDDALLSAVILKLFTDRQVQVTPALVAYLVGRIDRSFAAANATVAALDARALALGRPVNRVLAAELLAPEGVAPKASATENPDTAGRGTQMLDSPNHR